MCYLTNTTTTSTSSPYGADWDLLTLGHTGINNRPAIDQSYWVSHNDPTVISLTQHTWNRKPDLRAPSLRGNHTRITMRVSRLTDLAAYAVTLRGAASILYDQALLPNATLIDVAISHLCHDNTLTCYGAYPMLMGRYRAIGPKTRDSARRTSSNAAEKGSGGG